MFISSNTSEWLIQLLAFFILALAIAVVLYLDRASRNGKLRVPHMMDLINVFRVAFTDTRSTNLLLFCSFYFIFIEFIPLHTFLIEVLRIDFFISKDAPIKDITSVILFSFSFLYASGRVRHIEERKLGERLNLYKSSRAKRFRTIRLGDNSTNQNHVFISDLYLEHIRYHSLRKCFTITISSMMTFYFIKQQLTTPLSVTTRFVFSLAVMTVGLTFILKYLVLKYRIKKGFFGYSKSEACELINFINHNKESINNKPDSRLFVLKEYPSPVLQKASDEVTAPNRF